MDSVGLLERADGRLPGSSSAHPPEGVSDNAATQQHEDQETQARLFHTDSAFAADELTVAKGIPPELTFARKFSHTGATVTYLRKLRRYDAFACAARMTGKGNAAPAF
jgi:hypothetical protein